MKIRHLFICIFLLIFSTGLKGYAQDNRGDAFFDFGVFAFEDGNYSDAEKNFKMALSFNTNHPQYNYYLGKTYLKTEDYEGAGRYLIKAQSLDPDIPGLGYDLAMLHYRKNDYDQAAGAFIRVVDQEPDNIPAVYYAGVSLFRQAQYDRAVQYFNTAARKSSNIAVNSNYYAGVCYAKIGDKASAVNKFTQVKNHPDAGNLKTLAQRWLESLEGKIGTSKPYFLYLRAGRRMDDNVRLEPLDLDLYSNEDDDVTVVYLMGRYNFVNRPTFQVGAGYSHYQTWYDTLSEYDLMGSIFNIDMRYHLSALSFGLSYLPSFYRIESSRYLDRHNLNADMTWQIRNDLSAQLTYGYFNDDFATENERDGDTHRISLGATYTLFDNRLKILTQVGYEDIGADHPDEVCSQIRTKLGFNIRGPWDVNFGLTGRYFEKQYDHRHSVYKVERDDAKTIASFSVSRHIYYRWLGVLGEYDYTRNTSNINDFEYERNAFTLSLTITY